MPYKDKEAARKYSNEYYHKNKDKIKAQSNKPKRKKKRAEYLKKYNETKKDLITTSKAKCYQEKREEYKERIRQRIRDHADLVSKVKEHYGCMNQDCKWIEESYDPAILDFHHCDPNQKTMRVSSMLGKSKSTIAKEINKCVVLCANCHRLLHHTDNDMLLIEMCQTDKELIVCQ